MQSIIKSAKRSLRKHRTIKKIIACDQFNNSVVNIHRIDPNNVGDLYCAPHHYFDVLKGKSLDIFDYNNENKNVVNNFINQISSNSLIVGGGGLLNRSGFKKQMKLFEKLTEKNKKIVLWGVGHNNKHSETFNNLKEYSVDVSKFGVVGTRDYDMPGEYVPCVSCLHSIFDNDYQESNEFGIVFHKDTLKRPEIINKFKDFPSSSNTSNLEELIGFIGSANKIITDSYHVMYWSMLMNKKVVVIPNSSKFFDFQYKPIVSNFDDALNCFDKTQTYSGLLAECRDINIKFADKVFNYLNI